MYRRILSLTVVVLFLAIPASMALALSGNLTFAWKSHSSFAVFSQKRDRPTCAIYDVWVSTVNQTRFDINAQPQQMLSWLTISITTKDCSTGNKTNELNLSAALLPTDKKNMYSPKEFGQSAELRVTNLKMSGSDGKVHRVKIVMLLESNGVPSAYSEAGFNDTYIQIGSSAIGVATLSVDNKTILKEAEAVHDPPAHNDDLTYISTN